MCALAHTRAERVCCQAIISLRASSHNRVFLFDRKQTFLSNKKNSHVPRIHDCYISLIFSYRTWKLRIKHIMFIIHFDETNTLKYFLSLYIE